MKKQFLSLMLVAAATQSFCQISNIGDLNSSKSNGMESHFSSFLKYEGQSGNMIYTGSNDWNHFNSILMGDGNFHFVNYQGWGTKANETNVLTFNELINNHTALTISYDKKIGIGTSKPNAFLDINVSKSIGYKRAFQIQNDYNLIYFNGIDKDGNENQLTKNGDFSLTWNNTVNGASSFGLVIGPKNGTGLKVNSNGSVGIGTGDVPAGFSMAVNGKMICEELQVDLKSDWPDYVFHPEYKLVPLEQLEAQIDSLGHLPGVPSQLDMKQSGISIGEMTKIQMEKIEEITLYLLDLKKENDELRAMMSEIIEAKN